MAHATIACTGAVFRVSGIALANGQNLSTTLTSTKVSNPNTFALFSGVAFSERSNADFVCRARGHDGIKSQPGSNQEGSRESA
jgi:hypothetical protein